jgi:xanthine/uracil/vitamin C permease (AzgA family)
MAFIGKLPFGLAPGMGLNAFFVFSVCMGMGYSWQFALTAVFIEGLLFILLTVTNIREAIVNAIPQNLRYAIGAGIGLFIAFIGMQNAGIIVNNDATLVSLGEITKGSALLAIIGLVITGVLYAKNVRGAMLIGILVTTLIGIPMGITEFKGVVSMPESIAPIFCQFEWDKVFTPGSLVQGCAVVRTAFAEEHPDAVAAFLKDYEASVQLLTDDVKTAAQCIEDAGIFQKAAVAEKAIPRCNICFITGEEMETQLAAFYDILKDAAPQSIGGAVPGSDFYFIVK